MSECLRRKYKLDSQVSAGGIETCPHKMVSAINLLHYNSKFQNFGGRMWNLKPGIKSEGKQMQFYVEFPPKEDDNHDDSIMTDLLLNGKVCYFCGWHAKV